MSKITQDMRYRQSLIAYSYKHGVTAAARRYKTNRQYIHRWRKRYDGTYSSALFLKNAMAFFKKHGFAIACVQTDNGFEFTNRFSNGKPTFFEQFMAQTGILHKLIRTFTPRHNGKVERSHRKDNEYFYAVKTFYSFTDFRSQLAVHNRAYNNFPMRPLCWLSPLDFLRVTYL